MAHLRGLAAEGGRPEGGRRNGFNLLAAGGRLAWFSNRGGEPIEVEAGVHVVSNALLDTPWPKVRRAAAGLAGILGRSDEMSAEELFALLADREPAPDEELPDTGVGLAAERILSSPFIAAPGYGTRGTTLLLVARNGRATFLERRFDDAYRVSGRRGSSSTSGAGTGPEGAPDPGPEKGLQDRRVRPPGGLMHMHHSATCVLCGSRWSRIPLRSQWIFCGDALLHQHSSKLGLKEEIPCHFCSAD